MTTKSRINLTPLTKFNIIEMFIEIIINLYKSVNYSIACSKILQLNWQSNEETLHEYFHSPAEYSEFAW